MATLVNDLKFSLSKPCPTGFLIKQECGDKDYRSWRKVAVGLRATLIKLNRPGVPADFQKKVNGWLISWLDKRSGIKDYPVQYGLFFNRVVTEPDPSLTFRKELWGVPSPLNTDAGVFPEDPPIAFNLQTIYNYTAISNKLLLYIEEGWDMVQAAEDEGWITGKDSEVERAEDRPAEFNWLPVVVAGAAITTGLALVLYAAATILPVVTQYKKASK